MKTLLVILLIVIAAIYFLYEKKRSDELEVTARQMGLSLTRGIQNLPAELDQSGFYLFTQGAPRVSNLMQGNREEYQITLAEFFYDAPFGEEGDRNLPNNDNDGVIDRHAQMFAWVRSTGKRLPEFDLSPVNSTIRNAAANAGYQPVRFDHGSQFNKTFNLAGNDEQAIRQLFTEDLRNNLLQQPELVMESRGNQWLFYLPDHRIKASELGKFVSYIVKLSQDSFHSN